MKNRRRTRRQFKRVSLQCPVETLAEYDPALGALDAQLLEAGWTRTVNAILKRRRDGKLSGKVVWRRAGESIAWSAVFACRGANG